MGSVFSAWDEVEQHLIKTALSAICHQIFAGLSLAAVSFYRVGDLATMVARVCSFQVSMIRGMRL
jgi:uncharacterized membrane-anchored protein